MDRRSDARKRVDLPRFVDAYRRGSVRGKEPTWGGSAANGEELRAEAVRLAADERAELAEFRRWVKVPETERTR